MDVFYESDLVSVILKLIASDGKISGSEVAYLNQNSGFGYTVAELSDVYESSKEEIDGNFVDNLENGLARLRSVNGKLADAYKKLLSLICDIIRESDAAVSPEETKVIDEMKARLGF